MYPKLRDGDFAITYNLDRDFKIGDAVRIIIPNSDAKAVVRIAAQAGDIVTISDDRTLVVNNVPQQEEVLFPTDKINGGIEYPYTVPEDCYFVVCDYRTSSIDSRFYGAVQKKDIIGKITMSIRSRGL